MLLSAMSEDALRVVVNNAMRDARGRLHGFPEILAETRQPDADLVETMDTEVPDVSMREAMSMPRPAMSLRPLVKNLWRITTADEVEAVIREGTAEERRARFSKRYPFGLIRFSAVGRTPKSSDAFVTYEWLNARIDKHGDFQLAPAELHLVELNRKAQTNQGWTISRERSVAVEH
jgi:hypothetical protein